MRRVTLVSLAVIGLFATGCEDPNTTDYDPMGAAAANAGMEVVPADQIASCVESTKVGAFNADPDALERWNSVGQSDDALEKACKQIGYDDPSELATMHWDWIAAGSATADAP